MPCLSVGHDRRAGSPTRGTRTAPAARDGEGAVGVTSTTCAHDPLPTVFEGKRASGGWGLGPQTPSRGRLAKTRWGLGPKAPAAGGLLLLLAAAAPAIVEPKLVSVTYPALQLAAGEAGTARVRLTIAADGSAKDCKVIASSGFARLDTAACHALLTRATFTPASRDGVAVPWYLETAVGFGPEVSK